MRFTLENSACISYFVVNHIYIYTNLILSTIHIILKRHSFENFCAIIVYIRYKTSLDPENVYNKIGAASKVGICTYAAMCKNGSCCTDKRNEEDEIPLCYSGMQKCFLQFRSEKLFVLYFRACVLTSFFFYFFLFIYESVCLCLYVFPSSNKLLEMWNENMLLEQWMLTAFGNLNDLVQKQSQNTIRYTFNKYFIYNKLFQSPC